MRMILASQIKSIQPSTVSLMVASPSCPEEFKDKSNTQWHFSRTVFQSSRNSSSGCFCPEPVPLYSTVSKGLSLLNSSNCFSIHNIYGRYLYLYPWRSIIFWTSVLLPVWCLLSVVLKETVMSFCLLHGDASYLPSILTVMWFCDIRSLMEKKSHLYFLQIGLK